MRQTCKLCMSGWWWWWWCSHFAMADVLACLGGGGLCFMLIGWGNPRRDMLARPGGGGLSVLQENPSSLFYEFF